MGWARVDDGFHDHPKVDSLPLDAVGMWTLCFTWANRHRRTAAIPGHVPTSRVRKVGGRHAQRLAQQLVDAGLWEQRDDVDGYIFHDFQHYLPKRRDPQEAAESGRRGADSRWGERGNRQPPLAIANSQPPPIANSHANG